jgi:hypothetical protein
MKPSICPPEAGCWSCPRPSAYSPLVYPLLNRALTLPLLPDWADYLWQQGRAARLIYLLDKGQRQRRAAWRVLPAPQKWQNIVKNGLADDGRLACLQLNGRERLDRRRV